MKDAPWPSVESLNRAFPFVGGYEIAALDPRRAQELPALLTKWYPEMVGSSAQRQLEADFYLRETEYEGCPERRDLWPLVMLHGTPERPETREIVGALLFERVDDAGIVRGRAGALSPDHRTAAIGIFAPRILEAVGRALGAGLVSYYATLKTRHQQVIAERAGYTLSGIVPAADQEMLKPGKMSRVYEALYVKLLDGEGLPPLEMPPRTSLTANTMRVWSTLFGELPA